MKTTDGIAYVKYEIADIINNIAFCEDTKDFYHICCGNCLVTQSINIRNRFCVDNNSELLELMQDRIKGNTPSYDKLMSNNYLSDKSECETDEIWKIAYVRMMYQLNKDENNKKSLEKLDFEQDGIESKIETDKFHKSTHLDTEALKDVEFIIKDYDEVDIPDGSIIYCSAPYINEYSYKTFDFNNYYNWLIEKSEKCIVIIREMVMPEMFKQVTNFKDKINDKGVINIPELFIVDKGYRVDKYFKNTGKVDF